MSAHTPTAQDTARDVFDRWTDQLDQLLRGVAESAKPSGWSATWSSAPLREEPFGLGAAVEYSAPVLVLRRPDPQSGEEQRVTFEPRHRYTMGSAGRIDVYSYPRLREAMLLRIPDTAGAEGLTWEQAEERVANASWQAFSPERLRLDTDLSNPVRLKAFLESLVG